MYVYHQRFTGHSFSSDTRSIGQPVVSMDHIELLLSCNRSSNQSITSHFFHQISPVFTGKLIFVLKFNPIFFASFQNTLIHFPGKCLGIHIRHQIRAYLHKIDIFPIFLHIMVLVQRLHITGVNNFGSTLIFITARFRHDEEHFNTLFSQSPGQSQTCSSQSSGNMRWKLPAKHQYSSFHIIIINFFCNRAKPSFPLSCFPIRSFPLHSSRLPLPHLSSIIFTKLLQQSHTSQNLPHTPGLRYTPIRSIRRISVINFPDRTNSIHSHIFFEIGQ